MLDKLKIRQAFRNQRDRAKRSGISFELTFEQWLSWWESTGHFHERGLGKDKYCMARFGDAGPYALGNIKCITNSENAKEAKHPNVSIRNKENNPANRPEVRARIIAANTGQKRPKVAAYWARRREQQFANIDNKLDGIHAIAQSLNEKI